MTLSLARTLCVVVSGPIAGNAVSHRVLRYPENLWEPALPAIGPDKPREILMTHRCRETRNATRLPNTIRPASEYSAASVEPVWSLMKPTR